MSNDLRSAFAQILLLMAMAGVLQSSLAFADGPRLEEVPGPIVAASGVPAAASWPAIRYKRPLRLMVVACKLDSMAVYQRIARRLRASLDIRYIGSAGDDIYHVHDRWIEPEGPPTPADLKRVTLQQTIDTLRQDEQHRQLDVVFVHHNPVGVLKEPALQSALLAYARQGGTVVITGNYYPDMEEPLAAEWPARAGTLDRMATGAKRTAATGLAGVPTQWLAGWDYIPHPEATEGSIALSSGGSGAVLSRTVGDGTLLFVPTGPLSKHAFAAQRISREYDHDEIWLRLWDQLLYETTYATRAFPVQVEVDVPTNAVASGMPCSITGRVRNRTHTSTTVVSVHVTSPQGQVVFAEEKALDVPLGQEQSWPIEIPAAEAWGSGVYSVCLTAGDPVNKAQLHQALALLPVIGSVNLALTADRKGYALGAEAEVTLEASSSKAWNGEAWFGVYDFRGRLLAADKQVVELSPTKRDYTFRYRVGDHGVAVDTYWAVVSLRRGGEEFGRALTKFAKYERWSMRNEYQRSTWAGIACGPPSTTPPAMRLMAHAGMNALGNPGKSDLHYAAERWGWRYYNEGLGANTFAPVIEFENDAEVRAEVDRQLAGVREMAELVSGAFVLGSVGEEAGFKHGWGTRYYWDTPIAPEKACAAFRWFLKGKYSSLSALNIAWKTNYSTWDEVKLTKEFSADKPPLNADGWAHPKLSPLGVNATGSSLVPYLDSEQFYNWYYDNFVDAVREGFHQQVNPVTLAMSSAPSIGSANYDVRLGSGSCWNDSQWESTYDVPEPAFVLNWCHFDLLPKTEHILWSQLVTRAGHNDYWVDVPLMFNNDLTHTRASFALRRWSDRLQGHERIILDSRPLPADVAILSANGGVDHDQRRANMVLSLQVALAQGGFALPAKDPHELSSHKLVFAVGHQATSQAEADRLQTFVESGGTLVLTPQFATQSELGVPYATKPGCGLAEKWQLRVISSSTTGPPQNSGEQQAFPLDGISPELAGMVAGGDASYREQIEHSGWTELAAYSDHTPAALTRQVGKGRIYYINAIYASHRYIQWVTPTDAPRQGFYKLVEWLCCQAGVNRYVKLDGSLVQLLHIAVKQFTDPTGHIHYAIVRTSPEVPWVSATLDRIGGNGTGYDVLAEPRGRAPEVGRRVPLRFQPGAGKLLAFVERPVAKVAIEVPQALVAGQPLRLAVRIQAADGNAVPGSFPMELRIHTSESRLVGLSRSFSAVDGQVLEINTAVSDSAGPWTVIVTEGITGLTASATIDVTANKQVDIAPGMQRWGWPSELVEPAILSENQFVDQLRELSSVYLSECSGPEWMIKQRLGYYYDMFPHTRHAILQPLHDVDWQQYAGALRDNIAQGETFVLTGEDVGVHPGSGLSTYPHFKAFQLEALFKAVEGASWKLASSDGDTIVAALGKGKLVLCRQSIDAAGHDNPSILRWHQRWRSELNLGGNDLAIAAPELSKLQAWWIGQSSISDHPRTITWFADNSRQATLNLDKEHPLGEVVSLGVPPNGEVTGLSLGFEIDSPGKIQVDFGCDGRIDDELHHGQSSASINWHRAAQQYLHENPYRDDNGWRIIPVRVSTTDAARVRIKDVKLQVR